jgi:GT2 family glycosyltransferase
MITIIYSTHKDQEYNKKFQEHLRKTIEIKDFEILEFQNNNEFSLSHIYNKGLSQAKYDIVVCCHNDIKLESGWGKKLLKTFHNNPDYGIIGKAGSCYFPTSGIYWERMHETMVGQVFHEPEGQKKVLSRYSPKFQFLIPVVTIDGVFIAFDKTKIKHKFDETLGKFHFYDHMFCLPNFLDDVKIGVTSSFELTHRSPGAPNEEFHETKEKFIKKYGHFLPLEIKPESVFFEKINYGEFKKFGKVGVVIPTKGKVDLLFDCIDSFKKNCNTDIIEFYIADTGSNEEDKKLIEQYIKDNEPKLNIKFIEYSYYHFARVNNDVVKNHLSPDVKFVLFCNNDVVLLNDVVAGMLNVFRKFPNAGTVGGRLHYEDNIVQHNGIITVMNQDTKKLEPRFICNNGYYRFFNTINRVHGNSATLMMIRKNVFEKVGGFNEGYLSCFEDVELNYNCLMSNYENYNDGSLVAYHLDAQTRNEDPKKIDKEKFDYNNTLEPFITNNFQKLVRHLH